MSDIRVISGANSTYREFYNKLKEDCKKFGYYFSGYDYGDLGDGTPFNVGLVNPTDYSRYVGKIPDKPKIILDALNRYKEFLIYLDSDVRIVRDISEVVDDYDVGITSHDPIYHDGKLANDKYPHITCYLNAGVIFFRNNNKSKHFVEEWIEDVKNTTTGSDQEALTNLLRRHITDWSIKEHEVVGAKVRLFPSPIYNFTGLRGDCLNPKIIHYTGTVEDKIKRGALK